MVNKSYSEALVEVLAVLDNTVEEAVKKIPQKFIDFMIENKSETYIPDLDFTKPISELNLKPKTEALLGIIYLKYWADNEGKEKFYKRMKENEEKYNQMMKNSMK